MLFFRLLGFNGARIIRLSSANWLAGRVYWIVRGRRIGDTCRARAVRGCVARVTLTGFTGRAYELSRRVGRVIAGGSCAGWGGLCLSFIAKRTSNNYCREKHLNHNNH